MAPDAVEGLRLSPQQRRAWALGSAHRGQGVGCALLLEGVADGDGAERVRRAVDALAARHQALRAVLRRVPGLKVPVQAVLAEPGVSWHRESASADEPESVAEQLLSATPEWRVEEPPLRATLAELPGGNAVLALWLPATHGDARSLEVLRHELGELLEGRPAGADEVFQYPQFSEYQNGLLDDPSPEGRAFWKDVPRPDPITDSLPLAQSADGGVSGQDRLAWTVDGPRYAELTERAAELDVSLEALFLALWSALLWRLGGDRVQPVIAVQIDGREFELLQDAVGRFSRALPVAVAPDASMSFTELARRVAETLAEAVEWADDLDLGGWMGDGRDADAFPLGFSSRTSGLHPEAPKGPPVLARRVRDEVHRVGLVADDRGDAVELELWFDPGCVERTLAENVGEQLMTLLDRALAAPTAALMTLDTLDDDEARRVVEAHLERPVELPATPVHQLFAAHARRHPERPAVVCDGISLTYGEVAARAGSLAGALRAVGVGPEVPVGVCLERSAEMVVALLATLEAGGAYVPLDPQLPAVRIAEMVEEAGVEVILSRDGLQHLVPDTGLKTVFVDGDGPSDGLPEPVACPPEAVAYILFTSGSTGRPKGVGVEHRQLTDYAQSALRFLDLPEGAAFGLVSSFGADLGNTTLFGALAGGGTLVVATGEEAFSPDAFSELFTERPIDVLKIAPSHLRGLLQASTGPLPLPREALVLGGEALDRELVARVREMAPGCRVINHYGPTETTVGVAAGEVPAADDGHTVPLGRPLANQRLYVLDQRLVPKPDGVPGGLWIGGGGVARGYVGRPGATAERFRPDPWSDEPGARMYESGDRVRWRADGSLLFLGRQDDQVKIRGFRVEPGEIEATLAKLPGIEQAAVLAAPGPGGQTQLVAYVAGGRGVDLDGARIRGDLRESLPEHMVPAKVALLPALPLTSNGKIDRRALPDPESVEAEPVRRPYVAPEGPVETILAEIWSDVLDVDRVGSDDDFFELGGHSLLAMQVLSRIQETLRVELPLRVLFQSSTVADLAGALIAHDPGSERVATAVLRVREMSGDEVERQLRERGAPAPEGSRP